MSERESMLGKTLKNFASQLLSLLISIGDRFLLTAVLLRMWPTDLFADWTTLMAWSGLLGLADLGFVIFVGNRLQKAFGLGDEVGFQRQVGTAAFIYALLGLLMVAIAALLAVTESASPFVSIRSLNSSEASLALFSLGVMQAVQTTKSAFTQIYRGRGEFSRGVIIDSVSTLCIVVTALAAALGGAGPRMLALTYIAAQLVFAWGILLTDLRRRYPNLRLWPLPPSVSELREAGLAMRWYALTYALPTIWLQAPVLLLSALGLGGPMVVTFVLHRTLVNFGRTFVVMLSTSAGVELTPHVHCGNTAMIERGITFVGRSVAAMGGVMAAGLLTFGASIVQLMDRKIGFVRYGDADLARPSRYCRGAGHTLALSRASRGHTEATGDRPGHANNGRDRPRGPARRQLWRRWSRVCDGRRRNCEHWSGAADLVDKATRHRLLATRDSMPADRFRGSPLGRSRGKSGRLRDRNTGLGDIDRMSRHMGRRNGLADHVFAIAGRPT